MDRMKRARDVATAAAREAACLAKERFAGAFAVQEKGQHGDLVTEVDGAAEELIAAKIREAFPTHAIEGEESGLTEGEDKDWLWLIDPLDGTNNFAIGLPVYGVCVTLIHRGEPILGVICDSHQERVYVAERGKGATCDGEVVRLPERWAEKKKLTVSWIQGHAVQQDVKAKGLKWHLEMNSKRILSLWAPSIAWAMLARGDLDVIVLYNSEGEDLYAGVLLAREAGAAVVDFDGKPFTGMNPEPYIVACHPDLVERVLQTVRDGLNKV